MRGFKVLRGSIGRVISWMIFAALVLPDARAQFTQSVIPRHRTIPLRDQINQELEQSRFRFGPVRVQPRFVLRDSGYTNNVFGTPDCSGDEEIACPPLESDWTATIEAGARFLVPLRSKHFLRAQIIPSYTAYADHSELNAGGGIYSASLLALYNRLSLGVGGELTDYVASVSSEVDAPFRQRQEGGEGFFEVDLLRPLALIGGVKARSWRYDDVGPAADLETLERDENAVRGGFRYRLSPHFDLSAEAEVTTADFLVESIRRDNDSRALVLGVRFDRPKLFVDLSAGIRKGEGSAIGTEFPSYSTLTGSYFVTWRLARPLEVQMYGQRGVVGALYLGHPYFLETRNAIDFRSRAGHRVVVRGLAEVGSNEYATARGESVAFDRVDDVAALGGGLSLRIFREFWLHLMATETTYDSNVDRFDRSVLRINTSFTIGGGID